MSRNLLNKASKDFEDMLHALKEAMEKIDEEMIEKWVKDWVIVKTFIGLKFQEAILKQVSSELKLSYRMASPDEESKGIDGYIGEHPVSIKPISYAAMASLPEEIPYPVIFYRKTKDGIEIHFDENLFTGHA
ncbi:MjaI family restriction endonuclease [Thermoflavifilum thermophilum]|uniref:MjaI restriction endonuclease n=1 Tax=Thermoflavifilum thermophilum TaxID=1393122 RepID=A0A1I7N9A2_9BACT|nr:MjaI family restriction endonuclease [Thermoflavifilum thermophilum]SFV31221.1 MjaI restriction endonuclease [Thermoflavifilum thermophilum]